MPVFCKKILKNSDFFLLFCRTSMATMSCSMS